MAIEPGKLKAYVENESHNPFAGMPKMGNPNGEDEMMDDEDKSSKERGEELLSSMGEFGDELKKSADMIGENAQKVSEEAEDELAIESKLSDETKDMVMETVEDMPDHLAEGMKEHLAGKEDKDLKAVAEALCDIEGVPCSHEELAGYLKCAGECAMEMNPGEDMEEDEEEEEDDNPGDDFVPEELA